MTITEVYAQRAASPLVFFWSFGGGGGSLKCERIPAWPWRHMTWIYTAARIRPAMGVHHVTVALTLPAIAVVVYRTEGLKFSRADAFICCADFGRRVDSCLQLFAVGSVALPAMNWESAFAPGNLVAYHRAAVSRVLLFSPATVGAQFIEFCRMAGREFGFAWLPWALFLAVAVRERVQRDRTAWFCC
jgi:hypothetical protein